MITVIKNAQVMSPKFLGNKDVLLIDSTIAAIEDNIVIQSDAVAIEVIEATGKILVPGFIDSLVHVTGGGGEGGFTTRTPALNLSDATTAGITTLVAALGTDAVTRSLPDLLAKVKALNEEGLTAYCYTGSYHIPVTTLTGSVTQDIMLVSEMIGVGEVAIADHRSSQPTVNELAKVAAEARVGGMLSGKSGIVSIHCGDGPSQLKLLEQVVAQTDIPITQFYPTHINRNQSLLDAGVGFAKAGGFIDLTTSTTAHALAHGEIKCAQALTYLIKQQVPLSNITFSSDGHASLPDFDQHGRLQQLLVGEEKSLFAEVRDAVLEQNLALADALSVITCNPASVLGLNHKGRIEVGFDADVVLLSGPELEIDSVWAKGKKMVETGNALIKGRFE